MSEWSSLAACCVMSTSEERISAGRYRPSKAYVGENIYVSAFIEDFGGGGGGGGGGPLEPPPQEVHGPTGKP